MDIYEFSIQMEHDAESLYRSLASKTTQAGIKNIFSMLADDEAKHAKAVEVLQRKKTQEKNKSSISDVKNIFAEMKENVEKLSDELLVELRRALDIEKKGREFYKEKFSEVDSEEGKKLFKNLSKQEDYHYHTVENLIELVEKPQWWVEHAEFTPMGDDYY